YLMSPRGDRATFAATHLLSVLEKIVIRTACAASILAILALVMLTGCPAVQGITVKSAYGRGITYSGIGSTYEWMPPDSTTQPGNAEFDTIRRTKLEEALAKKGFCQAEGGQPDFLIRTVVGRAMVSGYETNPHGKFYDEGTLTMDVIDPKTREEIIWRGT